MTFDDGRLAAELAEQAGTLLLGLRAEGGDPGELRKAGDRLSHEFLVAELAARRPGDAVGRQPRPVVAPLLGQDRVTRPADRQFGGEELVREPVPRLAQIARIASLGTQPEQQRPGLLR